MRRIAWTALALCMLVASPANAGDVEDRRALVLFQKSVESYREGRFQEAIDLLIEARALKPEPVLSYDLGRAYEAIGDLPHAEEAYARYLDENPAAQDRLAIEGRLVTLRRQIAEANARQREPAPAPPP